MFAIPGRAKKERRSTSLKAPSPKPKVDPKRVLEEQLRASRRVLEQMEQRRERMEQRIKKLEDELKLLEAGEEPGAKKDETQKQK